MILPVKKGTGTKSTFWFLQFLRYLIHHLQISPISLLDEVKSGLKMGAVLTSTAPSSLRGSSGDTAESSAIAGTRTSASLRHEVRPDLRAFLYSTISKKQNHDTKIEK